MPFNLAVHQIKSPSQLTKTRMITPTAEYFTATQNRHDDFATHRSTAPGKTILIVDDDKDAVDVLALHLLRDATFTVSIATNGVAGLEKAQLELPWMIIVDLTLPKMSGLEVCKILKSDRVMRSIPIIVLTEKAGEADRIGCLEIGVDDYVTKPFSAREMVLRIKAVDRRRTAEINDEEVTCGLITLNPSFHHVDVAGKSIRLTAVEFKLLSMLMKKPGRLFSREMLLRGAWCYEAIINTRTVDTHIRRLRQRLGKAAGTIETVRGFGYRLRVD